MVKAKPFIKWVGGKSQLIEQLDALLNQSLASRIKMLATNTLFLCMSISIVILFILLVAHIINEIL